MYRVKLYGCTGSEPELFARFLAATLEIDPDKAQGLLQATPVVIAETGDRSGADRLKALIESRQGLCLVESDRDEFYQKPEGLAAASSVEASNAATAKEHQKIRRQFLRPIYLVGAGAMVAFCIVWLFSGSPNREVKEAHTSSPQPVADTTTGNADGAIIADSPVDRLRQQVEKLEKKANDLKVQEQWDQEELMALYNLHSTDYEGIRLKKLQLRTTQTELASVLKALRKGKSRLKTVEQLRSGT